VAKTGIIKKIQKIQKPVGGQRQKIAKMKKNEIKKNDCKYGVKIAKN